MFSISEVDTLRARAAIDNLNAALAIHETKGGLHEKGLYASEALIPLIASEGPFAINLGNSLYEEQLAAAQAALAPFVSSTAERDHSARTLSLPLQLGTWMNDLTGSAGSVEPSSAPGRARLVIAILTRCLSAVA